MYQELDQFYAELDRAIRVKATVMVVEDDFSKRLELEEFCTNKQTLCYSFSNAEDALEKFPLIKPDLIITDWKMPGQFDGLTFIRKIRKLHSKRVPILFLTAYAEADTHHMALKAKATVFMNKMDNIELLDEQINSLIYQREINYTLDAVNTPLLFKKALPKSALNIMEQLNKLTKTYLAKERNIQLILDELNNEFQINESKVRSTLKKYLAISPQKYITHYALYLAKGMLFSGITIQEISYSLGYKNDSNFVNAFKKKYSLPPKEYRKSLAKIVECT